MVREARFAVAARFSRTNKDKNRNDPRVITVPRKPAKQSRAYALNRNEETKAAFSSASKKKPGQMLLRCAWRPFRNATATFLSAGRCGASTPVAVYQPPACTAALREPKRLFLVQFTAPAGDVDSATRERESGDHAPLHPNRCCRAGNAENDGE